MAQSHFCEHKNRVVRRNSVWPVSNSTASVRTARKHLKAPADAEIPPQNNKEEINVPPLPVRIVLWEYPYSPNTFVPSGRVSRTSL